MNTANSIATAAPAVFPLVGKATSSGPFRLAAWHHRVLMHALGMRKADDQPYRNYFVASDGHDDMPALNDLLVTDHVTVSDNPGGSGYLYRVTAKGYAAVGAHPNVMSRASDGAGTTRAK